MAPDSATTTSADSKCEVMAAVERDERLVIADVCRDDAWLTTPLADAVALESHR